MKRIQISALLLGIFALSVCFNTTSAQDKKKTKETKSSKTGAPEKSKPASGTGSPVADGFTKLDNGLMYKVYTHGTGKKHPAITDHIEMFIRYHIGDSVMFDSRKMNNNKPVPFPIGQSRGAGDPVDVFMLMVVGDSAVIRYPVDSLKKINQYQPWMQEGEVVEYNVVLVSLKTDAEEKKDNAEKAEMQKGIDDKILQEFFAKNNIKASKTASGLYYTTSDAGRGENIKPGQAVNVNYTGMFLDGKKFDSNTDSTFHHLQPFNLEVGRGKVIKGWDEGLQLLKIGSKARFYIPSVLAYGSQDRSPQIPANSILVFDVEILDLPDQSVTDEKLIKDYLAKNKIQATKTASGLYYVITQKGLGDNAKAGKKVTMNYTGKTLEGNVFDSNTDPKFGHVQPFTFQLGTGGVIKGWDEGVQLLKLGSKASFFIPSGLAYGAAGAGQSIGPNAVLVFDVEVVSIDK